MSTRLRFLMLLSVFAVVVCMGAQPVQQITGEGDWYFPQTQHTVSGEFLKFYQNTDQYLVLFGYPITDVVNHPVLPGVKVQYFQRVRMELDPKAPEGEQVRLAPLGVWLYDETRRGTPVDLPFTTGACRMYPSREIPVCYEFLTFYDEYNGEVYFGEPISRLEKLSSGRLVQYFERARMEWWPENPAGMRVMLTDLGKLDLDRNYPLFKGDPDSSDNVPGKESLQLVVRAFAAHPLVAPNDNQEIFIVVQDQSLEPVEGVLVTMTLHLPDGQVLTDRLGETNSLGISKTAFKVGPYKPTQIVRVDITAALTQGPSVTTSTYFRIWW